MGFNNQKLMKDGTSVPIQFIGNRILTGSVIIDATGVEELLLPANQESVTISLKAATGNANNIFVGTTGNVLYPLLAEEEKVMLHDNSQKAVYVKGTKDEIVYYLVEHLEDIA